MSLKPSELFATPEGQKELEAYIERLPPSDRVLAWTIAGMTWNLACKLSEQKENNDA
jgi:hypothetical protein|tara:strand:- start:6583 stop:6753 length:171 start_codon:yes stop_codon:yes gene_type:complete